jgi:hypothetical protein
MIIGLQITGFIFALLMMYLSLVHYKKGNLNGMEIGVWLVVWTCVILAIFFPEILRTYALTFAVSRLFDLMVVGAFIVVITLVSASYVRTKKTEKKVEELVRKSALSKTGSKNK